MALYKKVRKLKFPSHELHGTTLIYSTVIKQCSQMDIVAHASMRGGL